MNCKQCGCKCYGGSEGRKAASLCSDCWADTIEGRLEQSKRRRGRYVGRGSVALMTIGTRVRKVKIEMFHNRTPPQIGTIVGEPMLVSNQNWEIPVLWDGRTKPEFTNTRRVQILSNAEPSTSSVR